MVSSLPWWIGLSCEMRWNLSLTHEEWTTDSIWKDSCIFVSLSTGSTMGLKKLLQQPRVSQKCRVVRVSRVKVIDSRNRTESRIPSVSKRAIEVFGSTWHWRILVGHQLVKHGSQHRRDGDFSATQTDYYPDTSRRERARVSDSCFDDCDRCLSLFQRQILPSKMYGSTHHYPDHSAHWCYCRHCPSRHAPLVHVDWTNVR